ncbi:MAG: hypothetical protein HC902_10690 [Calothrix sp. SM1_5_4]|nr:hypothetical protein [Calothrix sp. SM1_5_4]
MAELSHAAIQTRLSSSQTSLMKLTFPGGYIERSCGGTNCGSDTASAMNYYLGFFGPTTSSGGLVACYLSNTSQIMTSNSSILWTDSSKTTVMGFRSDGDSPETNLSRVTGGESSGMPACYMKTELKDRINLDLDFADHGMRQIGMFRGPFRITYHDFEEPSCTRKEAAAGCYDPTTQSLDIRAELLPNVLDSLSGVDLFMKLSSSCAGGGGDCYEDLRDKDSDGYSCDQLGGKGFSLKASFTTSPIEHSLAYNIPSGQTALAILCPYRATGGKKEYFRSAAAIYGLSNFSGTAPALPSIANLALWFDGADMATFKSDESCTNSISGGGSPVHCWKDKSGNYRHANTPSATYPSYVANGGGGLLMDRDYDNSLSGLYGGGFLGPNDRIYREKSGLNDLRAKILPTQQRRRHGGILEAAPGRIRPWGRILTTFSDRWAPFIRKATSAQP